MPAGVGRKLIVAVSRREGEKEAREEGEVQVENWLLQIANCVLVPTLRGGTKYGQAPLGE
jgi:hypothetical protein